MQKNNAIMTSQPCHSFSITAFKILQLQIQHTPITTNVRMTIYYSEEFEMY